MRSRSWLEQAGVVLGAAAEGIWSGGLAAALTGASGAALIGFACVTIAAAAFLARRLARGGVGERAARLLALALILIAAGLLFAAGRGRTHPALLWQVVRGIVYAGGLVFLGVHLGRAPQPPEAAVARAVRGFLLLCTVLVCAALAGSTPPWAPAAIIASLVAGGLLIATVRYRDLTDLVDPAERLPAWPWLLAVLGAVLAVIAVGALLGQILRVDVVLGALEVLAGVLRYALDGLAYVIGYAGAGILRGIAWLLGIVHVHTWQPHEVPKLAQRPPALPPRHAKGFHFPSTVRLAGTIAGALAAIGVSLALVALALRRFRRGLPAEVMVVEEREALGSLRSAAGVFAARFGRRLRRRLLRRRGDPRTPAELVRRRYAELEGRLSRAGRPRPAGVTVRDHLAAAAAAGVAEDMPEAAPPGPHAGPLSLFSPAAADLAAMYEVARYSAHAVDAAEAHRFEALARAFTP
jgi:hypothetical protein